MKSYAICVENKDFEVSLEKRKLYEFIPEENLLSKNLIKVIDESGEDYLYPSSYFILMDIPEKIIQQLEFA
jgi:hypothetical protein